MQIYIIIWLFLLNFLEKRSELMYYYNVNYDLIVMWS